MSQSSKSFRKVVHLKGDIGRLNIEADIADIIIEPHENSNIIVYGYAYGGEVPECEALNINRDILIKISKGRGESRLYTVKAKIIVPPDMITDELTVRTNIGDIRVDGLPIKNLNLTTLNGDILLGGITSETIRVNISNGDILLRGGEYGNVELTTINGDIRIEIQMKKGFTLTASTNNGKIKLGMPLDASAEVHASTMKGTISIGKKDKFRRVEKIDREYYLLAGDGDAKIYLNAVNGDISINLLKEIVKKP